MLSIFITIFSITDIGKNIYKDVFHQKLSKGIDKLFQVPNKYRHPNYKQDHGGSWHIFSLQNGKDTGYDEMKKVISSSYYKKESELGYKIKAIIQWQALHIGPDAMNPVFNKRLIAFIPLTDKNKDIDLKGHEDEMTKDDEKNIRWITHQDQLTKDLDTLFTNEMTMWAAAFALLATISGLCSLGWRTRYFQKG